MGRREKQTDLIYIRTVGCRLVQSAGVKLSVVSLNEGCFCVFDQSVTQYPVELDFLSKIKTGEVGRVEGAPLGFPTHVIPEAFVYSS